MTYIIATSNMKGGVGKTTLAVNLATCLASIHRKRVLVADFDAQISATLSLLSPQEFVKARKEQRTLKYLFQGVLQPDSSEKISVLDVIRPYVATVKGLDLLPGDLDLYDDFAVSSALHQLAEQSGQQDFQAAWNQLEQTMVKTILDPVRHNYDYIIIDCAPGYNLLTRSSLVNSDFYLLPAKAEPLSVAGIQLLERRIEKLRNTYKGTDIFKSRLVGIAFTMAGGLLTSRYSKQVIDRLHQDFSAAQIFKTQIPSDIHVSKAVDSFKPVILTHPKSPGSKAFIQLTQEFINKIEVLVGSKEQKSRLSLSELD
ncbi:MAG: ParA family protein [Prochlorotrichaceae cyanobacterium]|jgi:chromosome partitioning protein